jgi:subtilase family protein/N-acetylmuramoyl-L-alanine amidase-like protein
MTNSEVTAGPTGLVIEGADEAKLERARAELSRPAAEAGTEHAAAARTEQEEILAYVEFQEAIRAEWLDALRTRRIEPIKYHPEQSYLCRGPHEQFGRLYELSFVRQVTPLTGELKADVLLTEVGETTVWVIFHALPEEVHAVVNELDSLRGVSVQGEVEPVDVYMRVLARVESSTAQKELLSNPSVLATEPYAPRTPEDELAGLILTGQYDSSGRPAGSYLKWLENNNLTGEGITIGIVDNGIDVSHTAYKERIKDLNGGKRQWHGTFVAGHAAGAYLAEKDAKRFIYGIGIAPKAELLSQDNQATAAALCSETVTERGPSGAAGKIQNNSWGQGTADPMNYSSLEASYDKLVRNADPASAVPKPLVVCFSSGNEGPKGLTRPKAAKNVIVTGNSENLRPDVGRTDADSINDVYSGSHASSYGNCGDGRVRPDVVAPGEWTASANFDSHPGEPEYISALLTWGGGSSGASPKTAGACALLMQWWRRNNCDRDPSPAMLRALLVNGAERITTGGHIPNNRQGWGRLNLQNVLRDDVHHTYLDQTMMLTSSGEKKEWLIRVSDPRRPVKITLAWTDPPGDIGSGTSRVSAVVNKLLLRAAANGKTYRGNRFKNSVSVDDREPAAPDEQSPGWDNLQNIFFSAGSAADTLKVSVSALELTTDCLTGAARNPQQDFALVITNGFLDRGFTPGDVFLLVDETAGDPAPPDDDGFWDEQDVQNDPDELDSNADLWDATEVDASEEPDGSDDGLPADVTSATPGADDAVAALGTDEDIEDDDGEIVDTPEGPSVVVGGDEDIETDELGADEPDETFGYIGGGATSPTDDDETLTVGEFNGSETFFSENGDSGDGEDPALDGTKETEGQRPGPVLEGALRAGLSLLGAVGSNAVRLGETGASGSVAAAVEGARSPSEAGSNFSQALARLMENWRAYGATGTSETTVRRPAAVLVVGAGTRVTRRDLTALRWLAFVGDLFLLSEHRKILAFLAQRMHREQGVSFRFADGARPLTELIRDTIAEAAGAHRIEVERRASQPPTFAFDIIASDARVIFRVDFETDTNALPRMRLIRPGTRAADIIAEGADGLRVTSEPNGLQIEAQAPNGENGWAGEWQVQIEAEGNPQFAAYAVSALHLAVHDQEAPASELAREGEREQQLVAVSGGEGTTFTSITAHPRVIETSGAREEDTRAVRAFVRPTRLDRDAADAKRLDANVPSAEGEREEALEAESLGALLSIPKASAGPTVIDVPLLVRGTDASGKPFARWLSRSIIRLEPRSRWRRRGSRRAARPTIIVARIIRAVYTGDNTADRLNLTALLADVDSRVIRLAVNKPSLRAKVAEFDRGDKLQGRDFTLGVVGTEIFSLVAGTEPQIRPLDGGGIEEPLPDLTETEAPSGAEYPYASRFVQAKYYRRYSWTRQVREIVIHITDSSGTIEGIIKWFANPYDPVKKKDVKVSAHYVIGQDGEVVQMVKHNDVALHANNANSYSIGIEHVANTRGMYPTAIQYAASAALVRWLCQEYRLPMDRTVILGHAEADRLTTHAQCPNAVWDWDYYMELVTEAMSLPEPEPEPDWEFDEAFL